MSAGGSKKLSKSAKREKKKKKKKRKKNKKRESRDRQSQGDDDDSMDEQSTDKDTAKMQSGGEGRSIEDARVDRTDDSQIKQEHAVSATGVQATISPGDEPRSPVVLPERSKSRLADVLGPSDDEIDSLGSPIVVPAMKREKSASVDLSVVAAAADARDNTAPETPAVKREVSAENTSSVKSPVTAADDDSSQGPSDYFSSSQSSAEVGSGSSERKSRKSSHSSSTRTRDEEGKSKSRKKQRRDVPSIDIPVMPRDGLSAGEEGDDEGPGGSSTPSRRTAAGVSVSGEAVKDKSSNRSGKSKKKKSSSKTAESSLVTKFEDATEEKSKEQDEEEEDEEEAKWVQCDSCKKWRTVPKELDLNTMPDHWYCYMNTWDRVYASCDVDEEIVVPKSSSAAANHNSKNGARKSKSKKHAPPLAPITVPSDAGFVDAISTPSLSSTGVLQSAGNDSANEKDKHNKAKKQGDRSKKRKIKQLKDKYREVKWVQCESAQCGKWRVVPSSIDFNLLPSVWYCRLNTWAPELANCSMPNPLEVESFLLKSQSKKIGSATPNSGLTAASTGAARPSKKQKSSTGSDTGSAGGTGASGAAASGDGGGLHIAPVVSSKVSSKQGKAKVGTPVASSNSTARSTTGAPSSVSTGSAVNGNAAGSNSSALQTVNAVTSAPNSAISAHNGNNSKGRRDGIKKTVLEWAQCEKCEKWRKLPSHIKSSTLPDKWYCNMNHWDPSRANCSIAEEVDQEPLHAVSPLPSSQNWYPMPGQGGGNGLNVGNGSNGIRSKRGKLSYSELLYASTGQLRKTYTAESSTLSFEYQGAIYHRDDQYKHSSMYISPALAMAKQAPRAASNDRKPDKKDESTANRIKSASSNGTDAVPAAKTDGLEPAPTAVVVDLSSQQLEEVDRIGERILETMNLRNSKSFAEVVETIHGQPCDGSSQPSISVAVITAAVNQLVRKGLIEKLTMDRVALPEEEESNKRQKTTSDSPFNSSSIVAHYRKVPTRPLKASKRWHHLTTQGPSRDTAV